MNTKDKKSESKNIVSEEFQNEIDGEIASAPRAPGELKERLREHTAASPADSGGDLDANWEDSIGSGDEAVAGHNPTPDQSDSEANAHAMGVEFQDNEPLDLLEKMDKRDRNRFELDENSKADDDTL